MRSKSNSPTDAELSKISSVPLAMLLTVLLVGTCEATAAVGAAIDLYIEAEMELNGIPGASLAIVEDGKVSYLQAYGVRNAASQQAMRAETPVELASVSKAFTALAVLRLEGEGRVDRDSVVTTVLPELDSVTWRDVTLNDLLRHRSGLRRRHDFLVPCCGQAGSLDLEGAPQRLARADLASAPGSTFSYANSNYVLVAAVVQRVSGLPFTDYMQEAIFRPLGMDRATVIDDEAREWGVATPHEWQWGRVRGSPSHFPGWYGSSRVKASAADMGAYMMALLDPRPRRVGDPYPEGAWWEQLGPDYDLGWAVQTESAWLDGELVLEHTGNLWGADTAVVLAPRRSAGVAVLFNMGTSRAGHVARAILRSREAPPLPRPQRMSRTEVPDTWAVVFLTSAAGLFATIVWCGTRVCLQIRRGRRSWHATRWQIVRSAVLAGLAVALVHGFYWGSGPPRAALPATIRVALPALVTGVMGLLLLVAAIGLVPKPRR